MMVGIAATRGPGAQRSSDEACACGWLFGVVFIVSCSRWQLRNSYVPPRLPHARPRGPLRSAKPTDATRTLSHGPATHSAKPTLARGQSPQRGQSAAESADRRGPHAHTHSPHACGRGALVGSRRPLAEPLGQHDRPRCTCRTGWAGWVVALEGVSADAQHLGLVRSGPRRAQAVVGLAHSLRRRS